MARRTAVHLAPLALPVLLAAPRAAGAQSARPAPDTAQRLPAVVVTATRDSTSALASPLPTSTLAGNDLRREHGVSLAHTLAHLPGVRSLATGEQIGKPVIRGLSGARVLVLDDGLRLEDYSWSDEDGPSIDAGLAERVEVIRGPASVLYGSDALGGVVNAIPAAVPHALGGAPLRRARLEIYGASGNREAGGVASVEAARGAVGARAAFAGRVGQDIHTPAGEIRNSGFLAGDGELALGIRHDGGAETTTRLAHYGGEYKLLETDAPADAPPGAGGPARVTLDDRLQLAHRRRVGALDVEARGQLQRHLLQERSDVADPAPGQPAEATVFDLLLNTATVDLLAHHGRGAEGTDASAWRGTVGVSALLQRNDSRGIVPLVPDATIGSAGAFAFERLSLGRLALLAGARGDVRRLRADADPRLAVVDQSRHYRAFTGDLGAVYRLLPSLSVAANAGRAWRAPTLFELFANGPRLGEGRYDLGAPTLRPERSANLDVSVRWESARVRAEASAFRTRIDDYIVAAPTNETRDGLRVFRYGRSDAALAGGEASASLRATSALDLRAAVDAVRGSDRATGDPLPLMPPVRGSLGAALRAPDRVASRPFVSVDVERVASSSRLSGAERNAAVAPGRFPLATGAYTLVDVGGGLALRVAGRPTRLELRAHNATNRRYRDFLNRYKEFAYGPGASLVLRATTSF